MVNTDEWNGQTGRSWAEEWRRTDRTFGPLTEHLLARTRDFQFETALDVGCGAGELALAIARGRPKVEVLGLDISPQLLAVAQERGGNLANARFEFGDAAHWRPLAPFAAELIASRHGVMFFDDPEAAFANLAAGAAPQAGLLFSCFRDRAENPFVTEPMRLLPAPPAAGDPHAPGPFAFADPDRVRGILDRAGWRDIAIQPIDFAMIIGVGPDPVADAADYFLRIGPVARAGRDLEAAARERFTERLHELAARNLYEGTVSLRAAAWVVTGRKA